VLGLAFLLLCTTFRSVYIPILSIGLNLLSVVAASFTMVLVFQDGHLQGPLGFSAYGGITPWLPLFMGWPCWVTGPGLAAAATGRRPR
jgi:putative drug exporter of the RND superfamily